MNKTVIDVAKEAGVSRTTVSNVFGGRGKFSAETRRRVLDAAQALGYKPNLAARSLITNQSRLIGLILPAYVGNNTLAGSPFYNMIMDSIYAVLRDEAYYDLLIFSLPYQGTLAEISDRIDARNVDGILAIGEYDPGFLSYLESKNIPVVLIDNYSQEPYRNFSYINSEDETGGYLATRLLIGKGYRKVGLCALDLNSPLMKRRVAGYLKAIQEAGQPPFVFGQYGAPFETGIQFADALLRDGIDAVFCAEDMVAAGVLHRLLQCGVRVGQEFGLAGFDNIPITTHLYPELTTIDQMISEKGVVATRALLNILKKNTPQDAHVVLPVQLVERQSA